MIDKVLIFMYQAYIYIQAYTLLSESQYKEEECKDLRLYRVTPPGRTLSKDISIAFYLSSFLLRVSLLF